LGRSPRAWHEAQFAGAGTSVIFGYDFGRCASQPQIRQPRFTGGPGRRRTMCSLQLLGCGSSEVIIYFSRDSIQPAPILDHRLEDNSVAVPPKSELPCPGCENSLGSRTACDRPDRKASQFSSSHPRHSKFWTVLASLASLSERDYRSTEATPGADKIQVERHAARQETRRRAFRPGPCSKATMPASLQLLQCPGTDSILFV